MIEFFDFEPGCYHADFILRNYHDSCTIKISGNYDVQILGNDNIIGRIGQDNYGHDFLHLEYKSDSSKQLNFFYSNPYPKDIFTVFIESSDKKAGIDTFRATDENNKKYVMRLEKDKCKIRGGGSIQHLFS